jgi:hypothetical protein
MSPSRRRSPSASRVFPPVPRLSSPRRASLPAVVPKTSLLPSKHHLLPRKIAPYFRVVQRRVALCFLLFPLFGHRGTRRKMLVIFIAALTLAGASSLSGCGAGNGFNAQPPASYTLILTATSAQTQHTSSVVLNVQ